MPAPAHLAGYSELIQRFDLHVPLHHEMAAISPKNSRRKEDGWAIYPSALMPSPSNIDHLIFALKHEGVYLLTLKKVFEVFDPSELVKAIHARPTSAYLRRLCFFYEWLLDVELKVPAATAGAYVPALDEKQQYASRGYYNDRKFRVRDNLPGTNKFCPVVFKTHAIEKYIGQDLSSQARRIIESAPRELIARAAAFLLLSDSKASFAIEGENPPKDRVARWGAVIARAGQLQLSVKQLVDIQRELIGDDRFVKVGLREEGGFVGRHDSFGQPEPEHISANADDLKDLLAGVVDFDRFAKALSYHPVLTAAAVAFGFVYIHPFEDGNGRIHRFLMHHVLAERGFTPSEIIFPISSVIYEDIARYKDVLEAVSKPMLELIVWAGTERGNVRVFNYTGDYYRYADLTLHSEYMFKCIEKAVEKDLPEEIAFLGHRDEFHRSVTNIVDMSERTIDLLMKFLKQGHGKMSRRARENEFALLSDSEVIDIEEIYIELFRR